MAAIFFGSVCPINSQDIRSAADHCSGESSVKPPLVGQQASIGQPGSILPGTYIVVICAIDNNGKYSAPSTSIVAVVPPGHPTGVAFGVAEWQLNTVGYELFIGVPLGPGSPYSPPSQAQRALLTSYLGPKRIGQGLPALPVEIVILSIPLEELAPAVQGLPYSEPIYVGSLARGQLPPGLSLNTAGLIVGTPTAAGTFAFWAGGQSVQQFAIIVQQQLTISPSSVSFHVQQVQNQPIAGAGYAVVTVSGNAQNRPITFTQTQEWIIATIQTAVPGGAVVCCPTTIIAAVEANAFKSPGHYTGSLSLNISGFIAGKIDYSVDVLAPKTPPPPAYDPTIQLSSLVNAASFGRDMAVGSLVSLSGTNLADDIYLAPQHQFPTSLGGVSIAICQTSDVQMFNCVATPLASVSATQISFLAPNQPANKDLMVSVFRTGQPPARPLAVRFLTAAPGVFLIGYDCSYNPLWNDPSPCGLSWMHYSDRQPLRGAVTDQAGNLLTSANPARLGQQYTLWLTGLGVFTGTQAPLPVRITIGGTPTNALYDVTPSYVGPVTESLGLYRIDFPWPDGMMGGISTVDIQACADYNMEISFNIYAGTAQDPNVIQVPLLVSNGDTQCILK
jgi:hypothetical protein